MKWLVEARVIRHPKGWPYETRFNWIAVWKSKLPGKRVKVRREKGHGYCERIHAEHILWRYLCDGHKKYPWSRAALRMQTESDGAQWWRDEGEARLKDVIRICKQPKPERGDPAYAERPRKSHSHHSPLEWGSMEGTSDDE